MFWAQRAQRPGMGRLCSERNSSLFGDLPHGAAEPQPNIAWWGKEFEKLGASERAPVANRRAGFQPAPQGGKIFAVRIVRLTNNSAARLPAMLYAFRLLIKSPLFTIVAIMTLAIAIGANTAIFTLVDALLLRALPYRDPDRLVMAWANSKRFGRINMVTTADFANWKTRTILDEVGNAGICTGSAVRRSNRRNFS